MNSDPDAYRNGLEKWPNSDPMHTEKVKNFTKHRSYLGTENLGRYWTPIQSEYRSRLFSKKFFFFWNLSTIPNKLTSELVIASSPSLDLIKMNGVSLHRSNLPLPPPPISFWNAPSSTPHRGVVASILRSLFGQSQLSHVIRNASISQPVHFHSFSHQILVWSIGSFLLWTTTSYPAVRHHAYSLTFRLKEHMIMSLLKPRRSLNVVSLNSDTCLKSTLWYLD